MSAPAWTPGPWDWQIHDSSMASLGAGDSPGYGTPLIFSVGPCKSCADRHRKSEWEWGRCQTPSEADARLIAAAPDLVEALLTARAICRDAFKDTGMEWDDEAMSRIDAALTKAGAL